jgi:hypothetical protein
MPAGVGMAKNIIINVAIKKPEKELKPRQTHKEELHMPTVIKALLLQIVTPQDIKET